MFVQALSSMKGHGAAMIDLDLLSAGQYSCLTRFNKSCHPSQRPIWQVDKEAIGLSRVQQCSSTYNPPS